MKIAHLTTVDMSLRYLVLPQLLAAAEVGESIAISAPGPWVPEVEAAGIRHIPLHESTRGWDIRADVRAARQLWKILKSERIDILHTHNPKPGLYGRVLGRLAGVPIVVNTIHGLYATPDDAVAKRAIVYALEALASRFSDAELVQSTEDLELLTKYRISPRARTALLGNGVDLSRFDADRVRARHEVRGELGVDDDDIVVGIVGRLVAEKGYPELLEAVRTLDDRYVLVCVGPDDPDKPDALDRSLVERARDRGVRFLGLRSDVERLYAAMDLFVLPSHREGFPRSAMEAAAMGLPVIATDIRGCREVVTHGENGLLVPVQSSTDIAAAIDKLGTDPDLRRSMGDAGRRRAKRSFDERSVVATVMETYRRVDRDKGLGLFQSTGAGEASARPPVRRAVASDVSLVAHLHMSGIDTGFLPRLGQRFMRRLYRALIDWEDAVVLVADDGTGPVGFVAGVANTGEFYRFFARRHGVPAGLGAAPRLAANLRRAWETFRYQDAESEGAPPAELLAMAVSPEWRGAGVATALGIEFLEAMSSRVDGVRVVVGAENTAAIGAYRKMGFSDHKTIEVHAGEPSVMLVWNQ